MLDRPERCADREPFGGAMRSPLGMARVNLELKARDSDPDAMLEPANWPGFDDFAKLGTDRKLALLGAGLGERHQRDQAESPARALRVAYATLPTSLVVVIVALITALTA